jgi:hypothetical protein
MSVSDKCFILNRFPIGLNSLLIQCYLENFGKRNLIVPEYFLGKRYKLGIFEPFNILKIIFHEKDGQLIVKDYISYHTFSLEIAKNFERFFFLSRISKTILDVINEGDREIFKLLVETLNVYTNFSFNLIRFWINLATILGFSVQNLHKPGWINLLFLTECGKEEIKNPYCVFLSPKEFAILKRVLNKNTKPFEIKNSEVENLERFFRKFFILQRENF